ncbi:type II toxin-antitoxin system VapC family toxin [Phenylobacterium sp.]|uniref:type II toxin-antitoxin system VapC family toxin n=1 Tax=Phenylobacterium sp. TaxID=1871053 RepID=UPI00301D3A08
MIVVDTSALIAIAAKEVDWRAHLAAIEAADRAVIGQVNFVETGTVLVSRGYIDQSASLTDWLDAFAVTPYDAPHLGPDALSAYLRYGKGRHPARLNLGDCFAYALAKALDAPLLYKGDDFARTDVRSAL